MGHDLPVPPIILTPGPVAMAPATRGAMRRNFSLEEPEFLTLTAAHAAEGQEARFARVADDRRPPVAGLRGAGFETVVPAEAASPVIATFHEAAAPCYDLCPLSVDAPPRIRVPRPSDGCPELPHRVHGRDREDREGSRRPGRRRAMAEMGVTDCGAAAGVAAA